MNIFVVGLGQVGSTVVEALYHEHEVTVIDYDAGRLRAMTDRYEVAPIQGNGASRRVLANAGVRDADLLIACTSRDEVNIVSSMFTKRLSPDTKTIVRTTNVEYLDLWRERELDVDFMISSEEETAHAVSRIIGVPAARHTDVFADGQVQMVEFDVESGASTSDGGAPLSESALRAARPHGGGVVGRRLRDADIPADSKVASIIRGGKMILPRGDESILPGDRIIVIGSPTAAREWGKIMSHGDRRVDDVVVVGAGQTGVAIARLLIAEGIRVRLLEASAPRAREVAEELPEARVFHATGLDEDFIEREKIGSARASVFAMPKDADNLFAATLAKLHGVSLTVAIVHDVHAQHVFDRAGVDAAVNPRTVAAEEIIRFAHDPRIQQVAMLEGDRFEVLDITVREESSLCGIPFKQLPMTGSLIGAIVRGGRAFFPHGDDVLHPGDRAIVFTESSRVPIVERRL
ncbi:MAG: Trk system potassium transporter TrkA [Thermoleophilia bacterium]|nr:Trk system potassium transporter TrkA [Thermoleophilia bacterium]MDQ3857710.1 Trk system potassium transporter TrkA [Actinomycetota bacterium]